MADRFVAGDTVTLTNTFAVSGAATDPSTVSLVVTDPAGTATTYTYAGATITKSSTGVYTKNITASTAGLWAYTWTGTGTAADVANGTFEVHANQPVAASAVDILTLIEARQALSMNGDEGSAELALLVSAVSGQLDELCGPIVQRTVTGEAHDGGALVRLKHAPVASVTSVVEYDGTVATTVTAETNTAKATANYVFDSRTGQVRRRSNGWDYAFPAGRGNVVVTYVAGRAATTAAVDAKFKQAASMMLRNLWVAERASGSETFGAFTDAGGSVINPLYGPGLLNKVVALLQNEIVDGVAVL